MRYDWVPFSAAALVAGATALSVGALLVPTAEDTAATLSSVEQHDGRWLAVALLFFLASVMLTIGLPSILTLFDRRGARLGLTAVAVFTVGCVGTAGYAVLLAFVRALVVTHTVDGTGIEVAVTEGGLSVFLYGWIAAFYLGEFLLAIALFRSATTARWIPALLLFHVLLLPVSSLLPDTIQSATALLITVALSGVGISAAQRHLTTTAAAVRV